MSDLAEAARSDPERAASMRTGPTARRRVVYFTIVALGASNGGAKVCRNHAQRLTEITDCDLTICTAGDPDKETSDAAFATALGCRHIFVPFAPTAGAATGRGRFLHEKDAAAQPHVDRRMAQVLDEIRPSTLVIDYFYSALFVLDASRRRGLKTVLITLNKEVSFFRNLQKLRLVPDDCSLSIVAAARLAVTEQRIYGACNTVVALTAEDLPFARPRLSRMVINPMFDPKPPAWSGTQKTDIFFVGNVGHYPNKLAVEWLVTRLAPALLEHECTAQLCIVGASRENIKTEQFPPNVDLLGTSSDEEVEKLFRRCGLFIAPIANAFGSKIKLLDCLVFGTPFACTANALSGLSGLEGIPTFALDDPHGAARLVSDLLADETARLRLSERVSAYRNEALLRQAEGWHRAIYRQAMA